MTVEGIDFALRNSLTRIKGYAEKQNDTEVHREWGVIDRLLDARIGLMEPVKDAPADEPTEAPGGEEALCAA